MPNFLYTIILLSGLSWFGWYKFVTIKRPDSVLDIVLFLLILFLALILTFSIPLYFILISKADSFTEEKDVYRKALRLAGTFGLIIVGVLAFRAFT